MDSPNTKHLISSNLFDVLKLSEHDKSTLLSNSTLDGKWCVYNTFPQTGTPSDDTERYFLYPDYVHCFEVNDSDEVCKLIIPYIRTQYKYFTLH